MDTAAPDKDKKKNQNPVKENPRETGYPEQQGQTQSTDAYNGDDKHGPLEEEIVEKERK